MNASAFTARCAVSSLSDMYSGIVAAVGSLKGPLHGGANEQVMTMLSEIGSIENVDAYLDEKFANKDKNKWASVIVYIKMVILERNI